MELVELLKLLGIVVVIVGFALKLDSILIVSVSAVVTAIVGSLGVQGFLEILGSNFTSNRSMTIFIMILLVTGTLERNGLREAAAALIGKLKGVTSGKLVCAYGIMRAFFGAFNVGFGGVAGFIRPVVIPMAEGALQAENKEVKEGKTIREVGPTGIPTELPVHFEERVKNIVTSPWVFVKKP